MPHHLRYEDDALSEHERLLHEMLAQLQAFPNERYADGKEAIAAILRSQVTGLEGMKKKLGTPLTISREAGICSPSMRRIR